MKLKYRKEIDGLRALAVLPVILYHADFDLFSGGFIGVDVFFVISGYLITSIILQDCNDKKFSLLSFYERRARRILPALFSVILFTLIFSFVFLFKSELSEFYSSVIATTVFLSNFFFWKKAPYFTSEGELQPLLHTWSLSIEEQFYLIFPIIIIILFKVSKKLIFQFLILCFFLSFFVCIWASINTGGNFNFYFTLTRAWELALGSIIAFVYQNKKITILNNISNGTFSFIGLVMIFLPIFLFNKDTVYPSVLTIFPVLGTGLILLSKNNSTFVNIFLSNKILVFIGLISYSFYLWHQPLLAFGKLYFEDFNFKMRTATILIAFLLSFISWKYVEKTFRNKKKITSKLFIKIISFFFVIFISFSLLIIKVFNSNSSESTEAEIARLLTKNDSIYSIKMDERQFIKNRILYENFNPDALVIGSSRGMQISKETIGKNILNLSVSGASIEDQIVITEMALEKFKPNYIMLGADPWLFNKFSYEKRWESLSEEYEKTLRNIKNFNNKTLILDNKNYFKKKDVYENLLIFAYERANIRKPQIVNPKKINENKLIINKDGSRTYGKKDELKKINTSLINRSMYKFEFSEEKYKLYESFLNHLTENHGQKIILVITPYHLNSYLYTLRKIPEYNQIEKKFNELSSIESVTIVGSYNVKKTSCSNLEFYDAEHPKESCLFKILKKIR